MPAVDLIVPGSLATLTGGYIYDRRVLEGLAARGWQTTAHAIDPSFPEPTPAALARAARVLDQIGDRRRVVIDGLALAGLLPLLARAQARLRLVALIHHPLALETGLDEQRRERLFAAERAALRHVGHVIVTSSWTRAALADYGVGPERIAVVVPGVERNGLERAPRADAALRLLTVGALTPRKGHAVLIEALATLKNRAWQLRLAGDTTRDPATVRALRAQIERLGLGARIELLGELAPAEVAREYSAADVFVLPSFLEGYGMVVAEAVAHGLPVVATTAGAIPDTLPAGAGRLVPPGDSDALAGVLRELCDDHAALSRLAAAAARAAATIPTWEQTVLAFAAALDGPSAR